MKKIIPLLIVTLLISSSVFGQEKKDSIRKEKKHPVIISIIGEYNYTNQRKVLFKYDDTDARGYSFSKGVTFAVKINKYFSIGSGFIYDEYIMNLTYNSQLAEHINFIFTGIPLDLDFFYSRKRFAVHFIPELRLDGLEHNSFIYPIQPAGSHEVSPEVRREYSNKSLLLFCPKLGIEYKLNHIFSVSLNFLIKQTAVPLSNSNSSSPWDGIEQSFYSLSGNIGINCKF